MVLKKTSTLNPASIERLMLPPFNAERDKGWIKINMTGHPVIEDIRECVPETFESAETLEYLGLTEEAALKGFPLIVSYQEAIEAEIDSSEFLYIAELYLDTFPDSQEATFPEWYRVIESMSVRDVCLSTILDRRHWMRRREYTAMYSIHRLKEEKWRHLIKLNERMESALLKVEAMEHHMEDC